jgi:hypothetical protein
MSSHLRVKHRACADGARRQANTAIARQHWDVLGDVACRDERIYLTVVACGSPVRAVARVSGLSHTAVRKVLLRVEERREDPAFDRRLGAIEMEIAA